MSLLAPILAAALAFTPGWTSARYTGAMTPEDTGGDMTFITREGGGFLGSSSWCASLFARLSADAPPPVVRVQATLLGGPVESGDGYVAVIDDRECDGSTVDLADLDADGRIVRRMPLPVRGELQDVWLTPHANGGLTIYWAARDGVHLLTRAADGRLGAPVTVPVRLDRVYSDFSLAAQPDGSTLIAWASDRKLQVATVSPAGAVGAPVLVGRTERSAAVSIAVQGRHTVVAWTTPGAGAGRVRLYAAIGEGERFGRARLVDRARFADTGYDGPSGPLSPRIRLGPDGRALLVWSRYKRYGYELRAAMARPGEHFGAARTLPSLESDLQLDRDGKRISATIERSRVIVTRAGEPEEVAISRDGSLLELEVLDDGRLRVSWFSGLARDEGRDDPPVLHVATKA